MVPEAGAAPPAVGRQDQVWSWKQRSSGTKAEEGWREAAVKPPTRLRQPSREALQTWSYFGAPCEDYIRAHQQLSSFR